jgi:phosphate transport system protein
MTIHLIREVEHLKKMLLELSALVEDSVWQAVKAIEKRDAALANQVIDADTAIDQVEVEIEEECLKVLALHQPVASDLRFLVAVLKMNNDLERIGDLAVNIAERAAYLATQTRMTAPFDFPAMVEKARRMLKNSLDALVNEDVNLAREVCAADDEVDALNRKMYELVEKEGQENPQDLNGLLHLLSTSRHLERIADLATNIAEDVIYMATGEIVRHRSEDYTAAP